MNSNAESHVMNVGQNLNPRNEVSLFRPACQPRIKRQLGGVFVSVAILIDRVCWASEMHVLVGDGAADALEAGVGHALMGGYDRAGPFVDFGVPVREKQATGPAMLGAVTAPIKIRGRVEKSRKFSQRPPLATFKKAGPTGRVFWPATSKF
jgi:hypothetical protein